MATRKRAVPTEAELDTIHTYADQRPTGFEVIAVALSSRLHAEILTDIVPRLCSGWQPHMNVSTAAHDYLCSHASELFDVNAKPSTQRVTAVKARVTNVLKLLEHLDRTAALLQREMLAAVEVAESGEYPDDSDG